MWSPSEPPSDPEGRLRAISVLAGLTPGSLRRLAEEVEWVDAPGGTVLFRQGDVPDAVYFLISGRVRVTIADRTGVEQTITELTRGEPVGELGLLASVPRSATVTAVRDCTLARLSTSVFERLVRDDAPVVSSLIRTVARRLVVTQERRPTVAPVSTIAVVSLVPDRDAAAFVDHFGAALRAHRPVSNIDQNLDDADRLRSVIDEADRAGEIVLGSIGRAPSLWGDAFLRQSDRVLVLVDGTSGSFGTAEAPTLETLARVGDHTQIELVVRQPSSLSRPRNTARWLDHFDFAVHHHIRVGVDADMARLARHLMGTSVGLVLGGGGARAFAHIGAYRALVESGIPIDRVGGSSIGAVIAAQIASGLSPAEMSEINHREWRAARINRRLTVPLVSLLSVRTAVPMFERMFGDGALEDLWLPCFTTTVDLSSCQLVAHSRGQVARWVRASASPPGIWPPVVADDGSLHVDGGVLDNLPVQLMRQVGPGRIVTVNVSPYQPMVLSGEGARSPDWLHALRGLTRSNARASFPNIVKILYRTAIVTSLGVQSAARASSDLYIEPDVTSVGLADYDRILEVVEAGYVAARQVLAAANVFTDH